MKKISVVALVGLAAAISTLRGDIIPTFTGTTASGTNTVWNYQINITTNEQVTAGDFFTIYDFGPFIAGSNVQPAGWTFSSAFTTPPAPGTLPPDNPTLQDLTWTYNGASIIPAGTTLSPFSVTLAGTQFQQSPPTNQGYFTAQATRDSGPNAGTKISNIGRVSVPVPVPEPATLSLLALGAAGSAFRAIRKRSK